MNSRAKFLPIFFVSCFLFLIIPNANAEYRTVPPGVPITLGEFVYDDDYVATTTPCNITISNPAASIVVNNILMTADSTGWHYYTYSVPGNAAEGSWPASMSCGTAGVDLVRMDKTFLVDGTYTNSTSTISSSIWNAASRTLTSFGSLLSDINTNTNTTVANATSSILTAVANVDTKVTNASSSLSTQIQSVNTNLASASSSLSSQIQTGNTAISAVDAKVLSASSSLSSQIFSVSGLISALNNISAADVWNYTTRTLTSFGTLTNDINGNTNARLAEATSTIQTAISGVNTNVLNASSSLSTQILAANSNILSASSSLGSKLTSISALIVALNNISAADVWNSGTRLLTDSTLTSGGFLAKLSDLASSESSINSNTNARIAQATSTIQTTISGVNSNVLSASSSLSDQIQLANTNILSASTTIGTKLSSISGLILALNNISAADVWNYTTRTLTSFGTLTTDINSNTNARVAEATSTILASISTVDTKVTSASSSLSTQIQSVNTNLASASSSLSSQIQTGNTAISAVDAKVLSASSSLSSQILTANTNILSASSSLGSKLSSISGLIVALNNISAADVWNNSTRLLTDSTLTSGGFLAKLSDLTSSESNINANTNARIAQATSTILASVSAVDTKVTNASSSLSSQILANGAAISVLDGKVLGASTSLSAQIQNVNTAVNTVNSNLASASSSLSDQILANKALLQSLNNISAADVWAYSSRSLTDYGTTTISNAVWNRASSQLTSIGSIGKLLADNIDAQISSRATSSGSGSSLSAADVWSYANRTLSDYATSSITAAVWANSTRDLTSYGNNLSASDVWNSLTSSLTTANSVGKLLRDNLDTTITSRAATSSVNGWSTTLTGGSSIQVNTTYRTKLTVKNAQGFTATPYAAPLITVYDAARNVVASGIAMTSVSTGVYEYTYSVPTNAAQGVWESVVTTQVESGQTVNNNSYWLVAGSPAQVIINGVTMGTTTTDNVSANLTITNEGLAGYEYHYEWCVVTDINNLCGGNNDTYYGTGAKFINPSEDWNTNLTSTVPANGNYYFKVIVYFGTERSGSSRSFTMTTYPASNNNNGNGGNSGSGSGGSGGSGSGGNVTLPTIPPTPDTSVKTCNGADLNHDNKVNLTDFSIMMAFWKTKAPFKNACVDINQDSKVDTKDFSILMGQWGGKGTPFIKK